MSHPLYTNRLIQEKSPYLLQHAHNPVDWYPWGNEAFETAKTQGKPIFLSIGYATCHWCHVMEQESFQNLELAQLMNEVFVNIKVDREEMPEVDSIYMEFAQAIMSGGAGWPLNLVLTPDLMPFFAATYMPVEAPGGFFGMKQLIMRIKQIWKDPDEREHVIAQAGKIVDIFASHVQATGEKMPGQEQIAEAAELLFKLADPVYGGVKGVPKFPIGFQACFLLRIVRSAADSRALFYVERTLDMMHRGGIYDHLGGGFSRYSVDERWMVPHFEKMLYDNAILARVYLEAWQFTHQTFYREVAEETLNYVLREMTHPSGGFYSAEDADSEGHEGRFYTWAWDEVQKILGPDASVFCQFYGIVPGGNFEGRNILHTPLSLEEFAAQHRLDPILLNNKLKELKKKLWEVRKGRPKPIKDDKILAAWNGLMIYALAEAGRIFLQPAYLDAAEKAARFIKEEMWREGNLLRRWREGEARFDGSLDDYAFLIQGLLSLFEADKGSEWLEFAFRLNQVLEVEFKVKQGAYYQTNGKDPNLLLRRCEFYDGAEPSGNAVQAENLLRFFQLTGSESYLRHAEDILRAAKQHIDVYPPGACYHLMALQRYLDKDAPAFVIALNEQEQDKDKIAHLFADRFIPHKVLVWKRDADEELRDLVPISRHKPAAEGRTTFYLCKRELCEEPVMDLEKMKERIAKL